VSGGTLAATAPSPYRWLILLLIWFANTSGALIQLSGAPVQLAVASDFHLTAAQVAAWIDLPLLSIALLSIPAGLVVDRVAGRTLIGMALLIMGVFGFARGLASGFSMLCVATFLFGLGEGILLSGMPKVVSEWFPPTELGRAVGVYTSGAAVGVLLVFMAGPPLFHQNWRYLFLASGAVALVAFLAWSVLGRSPERAGPKARASPQASAPASLQSRSLGADIRYLLGLKDVLLLAAICACLQVGIFSWLALGFPFLVLVKHASAQTAGTVVALTMGGFLVGAMLTSTLSDRFGRRRPFFIGLGLLAAVCLLLLPRLPVGPPMWIAMFLIGFSFGTLQVLLFAVPLELATVAPEQVGTCEGIVISIGFLAGIAASPMLGSILGDFNAATAGQFVTVWLILAAVMLVLAGGSSQLTETGWNARGQKLAKCPTGVFSGEESL
jgi:sugar phosphate permease